MAEGHPDTSQSGAEGGGNQGPTVDNRNVHNDGGVVTGNNYGYNMITGISQVSLPPHLD